MNNIEDKHLSYQRVRLPVGWTEGTDRTSAEQIVFAGGVAGLSILDVGSCIGSFCLKALEMGARSATGLELNLERILQAERIARSRNLHPQYFRADIETWDPPELYDVTLCLNVLHHLRDPISVIRKLALATTQTLVLEVASFGGHDGKKLKFGNMLADERRGILNIVKSKLRLGPLRWLLRVAPIAYVGAFTPTQLSQSFFFSKSALSLILNAHMRLFYKCEAIPSDFKGRYFLRCTRLKIRKLVIVAGTCASGKTTTCNALREGSFNGLLDIKGKHSTLVHAQEIWKKSNSEILNANGEECVILHYDLATNYRYNIHSFARDPGLDWIHCAEEIDIILLFPSPERLLNQLMQSEAKKGKLQNHHAVYEKKYRQEGWLKGLYGDWLEFCANINKARYFGTSKESLHDPKTRLEQLSYSELKSRVESTYV
jgi:SAM-dependent methyltransferase